MEHHAEAGQRRHCIEAGNAFGLLVGTSSRANVAAALCVAGKLGAAALVVTILCDGAERDYFTKLFDWTGVEIAPPR